MSHLEPTKTYNSGRFSRSRSATLETSARRSRLSRVFSAQHIDDNSHYHSHDELRDQQLESPPTEDSNFSKTVEQKEDGEAGGNAGDEVAEAGKGAVNERDEMLKRLSKRRRVLG